MDDNDKVLTDVEFIALDDESGDITDRMKRILAEAVCQQY